MATWSEVTTYVKNRYPIDDERTNALKIIFDIDSGRSQIVVISRTEIEGDEWVEIASPVGRHVEVDATAALRIAASQIAGGLMIDGDLLLLRHAAPLDNLDINELEQPLRAVVIGADQIESNLLVTDEF